MKSKDAAFCGFLNIHKAAQMTSHDVVSRCRKIFGMKQIGHAGTLDPAATGVLVLALGKATRLLRFLDDDKTYRAEILLGTRTDTDDMEGKVIAQNSVEHLEPQLVKQTLLSFLGTQEQLPPIYSAVHLDGKRLYDLAREAQSDEDISAIKEKLTLRQVTIHEIQDIEIELPLVRATIKCSKGTYIRSIARDLGDRLNVGGSLKSLIRTTSGRFELAQSRRLEDLALINRENLDQALTPIDRALPLTSLTLQRELLEKLCLGQAVSIEEELPDGTSFVLVQRESADGAERHASNQDSAPCRQNILVARVSKADQTELAPEVVFGRV